MVKVTKNMSWPVLLVYRALNKARGAASHFFQRIRIELMVSKFNANGDNNILDYGIYINHPENISLGSNVFIGRNVILNAYDSIIVGDYCAIADGCKLISANHSIDRLDLPIKMQEMRMAPIELKEDVWLGYGAIVLPGVTLGRGCVVGAGAVVTKSFGDYSIIGGAPAAVIGMRK